MGGLSLNWVARCLAVVVVAGAIIVVGACSASSQPTTGSQAAPPIHTAASLASGFTLTLSGGVKQRTLDGNSLTACVAPKQGSTTPPTSCCFIGGTSENKPFLEVIFIEGVEPAQTTLRMRIPSTRPAKYQYLSPADPVLQVTLSDPSWSGAPVQANPQAGTEATGILSGGKVDLSDPGTGQLHGDFDLTFAYVAPAQCVFCKSPGPPVFANARGSFTC